MRVEFDPSRFEELKQSLLYEKLKDNSMIVENLLTRGLILRRRLELNLINLGGGRSLTLKVNIILNWCGNSSLTLRKRTKSGCLASALS